MVKCNERGFHPRIIEGKDYRNLASKLNYRIWVVVILVSIYLLFNFDRFYGNESKKNFAQELFSEKEYLRAIGEYQRLMYFSLDSDSTDFYKFQIGECYRKMESYELAKKNYYELILEGVKDTYLLLSIQIAYAKCLINTGSVKTARSVLNGITAEGPQSDTINLLVGITHIKAMEWENAKVEFNKIHSPIMKENAFQMLDRISGENFKSEKTALLLSTFIPGAGQIYAKRTLKGIISFSLNFSLGYLTYKAGREGRRMDAILIVYFGLQRFYFGNIEQARKYSREFNSCILDSIIVE